MSFASTTLSHFVQTMFYVIFMYINWVIPVIQRLLCLCDLLSHIFSKTSHIFIRNGANSCEKMRCASNPRHVQQRQVLKSQQQTKVSNQRTKVTEIIVDILCRAL